MPEIDRPFDAADDDHENVERRYADGEWVTDVWGRRVNMAKPRCEVVALDEDGNPVPRSRRSILDGFDLDLAP